MKLHRFPSSVPMSTRLSQHRIITPRHTLPAYFFVLVVMIGLNGFATKQARAAGENSPLGTAAPFNLAGVIRSAGSYDTLTGSATRTIPDLVVPGAVGAYPLVFARTTTSRYMMGEGGSSHPFGASGAWRHSYIWGCYLDNPGQSPSIWRVHRPDGSVIRFAYSTGQQPYPDPYMRSVSPGVGERLEAVSGSSDLVLHQKDGGRVYFQCQPDASYHAIRIVDPYGQVTKLHYTADGLPGRLDTITEPAGRYLSITYDTYNGGTVITRVTASNGQYVTYGYGTFGSAAYTTLANVVYASDIDSSTNQPCQATYTYQADNTGAGLKPLIYKCIDPHFFGPMTKIRYSLVQGSSVPYGQIQAEIDDASGAAVSSYNQSSLTETRGDAQNSYYSYSGYAITNHQDYDAGHNVFGYDANVYINSVTNANGHTTNITREPYVGKHIAVSRTDTNGGVLTTTYNYGGTAQNPYPTNPYWLMSITNPRGLTTTYTRDGNQQVTQITYPDNANPSNFYETFIYNTFGQATSHRATNGTVVSNYFDGRAMLYQSTDNYNGPANRFVKYYYDSCDRLSQVTDYKGHNTYFTYNGRHLLTQLKHDDGTHVDYTYDTYGNQTSVSNELQLVTTIAYDNHRRPIGVTVPINAQGISTRTTTFSYEHGSATGDTHTQRGYGTMTLPSGKKIQRIYTGQRRGQPSVHY